MQVRNSSETTLAVDDNGSVLRKAPQQMRLYLVLFLLGVVPRHPADTRLAVFVDDAEHVRPLRGPGLF